MLRCIADSEAAQPPMRFFAAVDEADVRRQAAESTARHGSSRILATNLRSSIPYKCGDGLPQRSRRVQLKVCVSTRLVLVGL